MLDSQSEALADLVRSLGYASREWAQTSETGQGADRASKDFIVLLEMQDSVFRWLDAGVPELPAWTVSDIYVGDGWELETCQPVNNRLVFDFSGLLPDAPWFWSAVRTQSDGGYQGLDAFELTHESVRWACGDDIDPPAGYHSFSEVRRDVSLSRADQLGRNAELASALREAAAAVRSSNAPHADANIFGVPATPESWANLLAQLAEWIEHPIAKTVPNSGGC